MKQNWKLLSQYIKKNLEESNSDFPVVNILHDLNEKERNIPRVQSRFKRSRHNIIFIFINSQNYYELPKISTRTNVFIYHIFKPNKFRDVFLYQDKTFLDMTLTEFLLIISSCGKERSTFDFWYDKR